MSILPRWFADRLGKAAERFGLRPPPEPRLPTETLMQLADALLRFESDPAVAFAEPGHARKHLFDTIKKAAAAWYNEHSCFVCGRLSIKHSHTLQMSGPLKAIAENNEVLRPVQRIDLSYEVKPIKIASASTFPGFCLHHERLFSRFETKKHIETDSDVALQAFRMLCREMYRLQHEAAFLKQLLADFTRIKFDYAVKNLTGDVPAGAKLAISNGEVETRLSGLIAQADDSYAGLRDGLYADFMRAIEHGVPMEACFRSADVLESYPVCVSGLGRLRIQDDGGEIDTQILFGVIPQGGGTTVITVSQGSDAKALTYYFDRMLKDQGRWGVLDQIEAWMLFHTDHWFLRPSVWSALPTERRNTICELMREEMLVGMESPVSIFDGIRREIISLAEQTEGLSQNAALQDKIAAEGRKLGKAQSSA